MSWKLTVFGGLAFYAATFVLSFATGPLIHEGVLEADYMANESFWRPELVQDPPDMAALMPMWILNGLISAFIFASIFGCIRPALNGAGWWKGLQYGLIGATFHAMFCLGWSGVFDLPSKIWIVWALEAYLYWTVGGMVLGWVDQKLVPEPAVGT